jgi:hypothetical protein
MKYYFPFRQQNIDSDALDIQLCSHDDIDTIVIVMKCNHAASVYIIRHRTCDYQRSLNDGPRVA